MSTHTPAISAAIHSRTHYQRKINFTARYPSFPAETFDYNTTSASAIVFEACIPEASYCLPCCGVISSVNDFFSVLARQCQPSDLFPDCVLCRHVSRSCQRSRSVWRLSFSTMSAGSFEPVHFSVCFVPRGNSPLIHLDATILSPHKCTAGPSQRV